MLGIWFAAIYSEMRVTEKVLETIFAIVLIFFLDFLIPHPLNKLHPEDGQSTWDECWFNGQADQSDIDSSLFVWLGDWYIFNCSLSLPQVLLIDSPISLRSISFWTLWRHASISCLITIDFWKAVFQRPHSNHWSSNLGSLCFRRVDSFYPACLVSQVLIILIKPIILFYPLSSYL